VVVAFVVVFIAIRAAIAITGPMFNAGSPTPAGVASAPPGQQTQSAGPAAAPSTVYIGNTDRVGAYLRRTPNLDDRLRAWQDGTELQVIGPDQTANGTTWKNVQDPAGNQGWIPSQYVVTTPGG
jgi:hypothetical protein